MKVSSPESPNPESKIMTMSMLYRFRSHKLFNRSSYSLRPLFSIYHRLVFTLVIIISFFCEPVLGRQPSLESLSTEEIRWLSQSGMATETFYTLVVIGGLLALLIAGLAGIAFFLKQKLQEKILRLRIANETIKSSEEMFRSLYENAPIPYAEFDIKTGSMSVNIAFTETFGHAKEEIPDREAYWPLVYPDPDYRKYIRDDWEHNILKNLTAENAHFQKEFNMTCKTGEIKNVIIRASLSASKILLTYSDISGIRHYQSELQKSLDRFRTLFELLPFSCVIQDMEGRFLMANKYFLMSSRKTLDELIGCTMEDLGRTVDLKFKTKIMSQLKEHGYVEGLEIEVQDCGSLLHILFSSCLIDWNDQQAVLSSTVDITDRKKIEKALKDSEENLRVTLNSIGDGVIATDVTGNVTRMNPVAQQLTGWEQDEAIGCSLQKIFHIVNAQTGDEVENPVHKVLLTGQTIGLANHTILIARDGSRYQIADSGAPIRNDSGTVIGVVLVFRDVTGEYEMKERLRQAQKMEAIGVLAGGIAHDFNNILSVLMGFTDLAKLEAGDGEAVKKYLDHVSDASIRARDLIRHILTFSRRTDLKKEIVHINPIIKETLKFIRASLPANIEIRQDLKIRDAQIFGDATHLHQILMNLFTNAGHAMKDRGGVLEVQLDTILLIDETETRYFGEIKPGSYLQLIVSDTGYGIPKAIIDRVFEPFFTTKEREEGTGMGLSTVYGILKEMGGGISVYSEVDVGTTFKVLIPQQKHQNHTETGIKVPLLIGQGKILIVDDEDAIVAGTQALLSQLGYEVTGFTNSFEALDKIRTDPNNFDLILTDMTMPGMNGLALSREIRSLNPAIPIVLCTGFSQGLTKEVCAAAGIYDMVMKPMIASELSETVYKALKNRYVKKEYDPSIISFF